MNTICRYTRIHVCATRLVGTTNRLNLVPNPTMNLISTRPQSFKRKSHFFHLKITHIVDMRTQPAASSVGQTRGSLYRSRGFEPRVESHFIMIRYLIDEKCPISFPPPSLPKNYLRLRLRAEVPRFSGPTM